MKPHTHIFVIKQQPESTCQLCGKTAELRPYGPNGEAICFECGMKDEEGTAKRFAKLAFDIDLDKTKETNA